MKLIFILFLNITAISAMDIIPFELQSKIIKNIFTIVVHEDNHSKNFIDQQKLEKYVLKVPIDLGMRSIREFSELQEICQYEIGGKKFLAQELFCLSRPYRDIFIRMANRSFVRQFVEGNISTEDYAMIASMNNKEIREGLQLEVLCVNRILNYMEFLGSSTTLLSWVAVLLMEKKLTTRFNDPPALISLLGLGFMGISRALMHCDFEYEAGENLKKITL